MTRWARALRDRLARSRRWLADEAGSTTLEWTMLMAFIGIPSYWIVKMCLNYMADYYRLMTQVNSLPFP